jgi:hypothetical protein
MYIVLYGISLIWKNDGLIKYLDFFLKLLHIRVDMTLRFERQMHFALACKT